MPNELATSNQSPITNHEEETMAKELEKQYIDPFEKVAQDEGAGEPLKFNKGEWLSGESTLDGAKMTAEMPGLVVGSRKWVDSKIVAVDVGLVASGFVPKPRDQLGDTNENMWPIGSDGKPSDPWQDGYFLRLTDEADKSYVWAATSHGAKKAVAVLCRAYARKRALGVIPIVQLEAGFYRHPKYGKVDIPVLKIVDWVKTDAQSSIAPPTAPLALRGPTPLVTSGPPKAEADGDGREFAPIDDDVSF
jgi:hypothetical protein